MQSPYADVLYNDVYGAVAGKLTHAYWVGKTTVDGVVCDHLAFAASGMEWQIWVGPRRTHFPAGWRSPTSPSSASRGSW
jgi:hypothetical protein